MGKPQAVKASDNKSSKGLKAVKPAPVEVDEDEAEAEAPAKGTRAIMLTLEDGTQIGRAEFIRARWAEGVSRSEIRKEVSELQGKEIAYQIIFQATKGHEGGPAPKEVAPAPKGKGTVVAGKGKKAPAPVDDEDAEEDEDESEE